MGINAANPSITFCPSLNSPQETEVSKPQCTNSPRMWWYPWELNNSVTGPISIFLHQRKEA